MRSTISRTASTSILLGALLLALTSANPASGSDHGDTPLLQSVSRHEARITDLYAFLRERNLVLIVCSNPAVPPGVTEYAFPPDLTLRLHIDNDSEVRFDDPDDLDVLGGTVVHPGRISEDIVFEIDFENRGRARIRTLGLPGSAKKRVSFFAGLRDDPFIRGPRIGRNVAAIVIEIPLEDVADSQPTLLIWATSKIPEIHGSLADTAGRALRSQFPENDPMNTLRPRDHFGRLGVAPDVMIYDTSRPAAFPNGRELTDDVVDLVGDPRVLENDDPFPDANDVPFLDNFPYLAPPHLP